MDVLGQEEEQVVEQTVLETSELQAAASEEPVGDEPTSDASEGAAPTEKPEGEAGTVALDPEAQLAAEALAATEEIGPEKKDTVPVAVVAGLRAKVRERDQLLDAVRQELANFKKPDVTPLEAIYGPLEKWVIENPEDAEVSGPPAKILLADHKWQEQEAEKKTQAQAVQARTSEGEASYAKAKSTLTDFDDIFELGGKHLSVGDKLDITVSKDPAMELYKRCIRATLQSGTPDAVVMKTHLQAKLAKVQKSVPAVTVNNKQKQAPVAPVPSAPTRNPRLAQVLATFDI